MALLHGRAGRLAALFGGFRPGQCAISFACVLIVTSSVVLGATLPFLLREIGFDPAHAGATIQVLRPARSRTRPRQTMSRALLCTPPNFHCWTHRLAS
jgi:hypothetical protein